MTPVEDRYRTLLDMSRNLSDQPTVKAVLHSLRDVLSSSCRLHGADLYIMGGDGQSLQLLEFDREADAPEINVGTKLSILGAVEQVLRTREPVFLPDTAAEMLKHVELAPFAPASEGRSSYVFPICTAQQKYGILAVTKDRTETFASEDVELLRSLSSHTDSPATASVSAITRLVAGMTIRNCPISPRV